MCQEGMEEMADPLSDELLGLLEFWQEYGLG